MGKNEEKELKVGKSKGKMQNIRNKAENAVNDLREKSISALLQAKTEKEMQQIQEDFTRKLKKLKIRK